MFAAQRVALDVKAGAAELTGKIAVQRSIHQRVLAIDWHTMHFNALLVEAGIQPESVRLLRHHTKPGLVAQSLYDLWRADREAFELYQSTQKPTKHKLFRTGKFWASFVSSKPGNSLFVGLYETDYIETRVVEWRCPYRGDAPGEGKPVDVFLTKLRPELSEFIGKLRVNWDPHSARSWARYASEARFSVVRASMTGIERLLPTDPKPRRFEIGVLYTREQAAELIRLTEKQSRGACMTGYTRIGNEFYVFSNVGISGRTGHDYPNRWDGKDYIWFGKTRTAIGQREINDIISGDYPVHIFWRASDRSPFTYAGVGTAVEVSDESPVKVRWSFSPSSTVRDETQQIADNVEVRAQWRRGPPPAPGVRTSQHFEGKTSVYLLVMDGPTNEAFPNLRAGSRIVKIGISNQVERRLGEMCFGLPPGCALQWRLVASRELPTGAEAYELETQLLERLRLAGRWIGGEFAAVLESELRELESLT